MIHVAHLGSRPLSRECLKLMHESSEITVEAVVTYPPDHDGWWEGSLYQLASELGYPTVGERDLKSLDVDYLISTLYYNILDEEILEVPAEGGLNLHQAELPRYRGSNTFSHAIMNARKDDYWKYGTTLHFMSPKVDQGDIVDRKFVEITEEDTAKTLYRKTERASVELFRESIPKIVSGEVTDLRTPQEEFDGERYFYSSDSLEGEKEIPLTDLADSSNRHEIYDKIRALDFPPFKPAYTNINGREIHLTKHSYEEFRSTQGVLDS